MTFLAIRHLMPLHRNLDHRSWTVTAMIVISALIGSWPAPTTAVQANGPALLVIDVQEFYYPDGAMPLENPGAASANIKRLLEKWRADHRLVVHVGHQAGKGMDFHADVTPVAGEMVFIKNEVCSFKGTELLQYLQQQGVTKLVICGMQTHMCVEAAVRAAADLDFECILVHDACATRDLTHGETVVAASDVHAATLATLDRVYAEVIDTEAFLAREDY